MNRYRSNFFLLTCSCAAMAACGGTNDNLGAEQPAEMRVSEAGLASVEECPNGGVVFNYGMDDNGDGELGEDEVDGSEVVCHGANGADGSNGVDGSDGDVGADGVDGVDGADGADGTDGVDGADGADGTDGVDGDDGADGTDGVDGDDGADGTDGVDGDDGADGTDGVDGDDGADGADGTDGVDGDDGADGTDGVDGDDGADGDDGYNSLISISPASEGASEAIDFESGGLPSDSVNSDIKYVTTSSGTRMNFIATDTAGSLVPVVGDTFSSYNYTVNSSYNTRLLNLTDNSTQYITLAINDGSEVSWTSINLLDDGNWATANITFYAYKDGVETASEIRSGDIPWSGSNDPVTYTFVDVAFGDADAISIAARASGGTPTPVELDEILFESAGDCSTGGSWFSVGIDNGDGGGTERDSILQSGEVDDSVLVCNP